MCRPAWTHCARAAAAMSGLITSTERRERIAARDAFQRPPSAEHHAVAPDDYVRIATAGRREPAADPETRRERRHGVLGGMDPAQRHTLRVERNQHHRGEQKDPENRATSTSE